jgi:hypothetical protein
LISQINFHFFFYFALSQMKHFSPAAGFALPRVFSTLPRRKVAKDGSARLLGDLLVFDG